MSQLVTRIDDDLARDVDALVEEGVVESRSDAVRTAPGEIVDRHRRCRNEERDIAAYTAMPSFRALPALAAAEPNLAGTRTAL